MCSNSNSKDKTLIAISGGIGSGKSVVCKVLACMGFPLYDCDVRAKQIMDASASIKERIAIKIASQAIREDGAIDRAALAAAVFSDSEKLELLNCIVHDVVKADLMQWLSKQPCGLAFVETAILRSSGIDTLVAEAWEVFAPVELRVERVCARNGMKAAEVLQRIRSQAVEEMEAKCPMHYIDNGGNESILLQINDLLRSKGFN